MPRSWLLGVFALALGVRLAAFAGTAAGNPASMWAPDSSAYEGPALALLQEGRFADHPGGPPQIRRTPVFPAVIAVVYLVVGRSPHAIVLLGVLLGAAAAALAAAVAARLGGRRAGLAAGGLLALDTASIASCLRLLSEPPFTLLVTAAVAAGIAGALGPPRTRLIALFGALSALAALTRPIGLFLVAPALGWILLCGWRQVWSGRARRLAALALVLPWVLLVGGWQVRNRLAAGTYAPSGSPGKFLLLSRGGDIVAQRDRVPFQTAREGLMRGVTEAARTTGEREDAIYLREGVSLVARHPLLFLRTQVRWLPELMLGTGAAPLLLSLGLEGPEAGAGATRARAIRWASVAHLLAVYAAFGWALWRAARDRDPTATDRRLALVLLASVVAGFVLLSTGPQGYSRLRAPFMPLLAIGAGLAFARWPRAAANRATSPMGERQAAAS